VANVNNPKTKNAIKTIETNLFLLDFCI